MLHRDAYRDSREELTPPGDDLRALILPATVTLGLMARPAAWRHFASGATQAYALTPEGWREIAGRYDRYAGLATSAASAAANASE